MTENELYHHGILGMKWGVRRYQNADGSLTSAGRARYGVADQKNALSAYRTRMKNARIARKARDSKIQDRVWKEEEAIDRELDKKYPKRFQKVSDEDWAKYTKVSDRAVADWKNSKEQYKADKAAARQELKENFKLTEGQKKALKIGAAVAGTALLAYGAYKISGAHYDSLYTKYKHEFDLGRESADRFWRDTRNHVVESSKLPNPPINSTYSAWNTHLDDAVRLENKMDKTLYSRVNDRLGRADVYENAPSSSRDQAAIVTRRKYTDYNQRFNPAPGGKRDWDERLIVSEPEDYMFRRQHIETTARKQKERRKEERRNKGL